MNPTKIVVSTIYMALDYANRLKRQYDVLKHCILVYDDAGEVSHIISFKNLPIFGVS